MAKTKQDLDDFEFDDFNFDSLDEAFEEGRGKSGPAETLKQIGKGAFEGVVSETLSVSQLRKFAREALPRNYSLGVDAVGDAATSARELYDAAAQEIAPALPAMRRMVKRFNPNSKRWLPGFIANRLNEFAEGGENSSGYTQAEADNTEITAALGSIFKTQMENEARMDGEQNIREEVREKVRYKQTDGMTRQLNAIRLAVQRTSAFNDQIAYRYQQKSLELQYRSYFALRDILKNDIAMGERDRQFLETIAKAAVMPESEKQRLFQDSKEDNYRAKISGGLKNKVSASVRDLGKRFKRNLMRSTRDGVGSIRDMITGVDDVADMTGEEGFSMANLMSQVASSLITDMFMDRRYERWREGVSKEDRKKGFMGALDGSISDMVKSAGVKAAGNFIQSNLADWKGKLNRWALSETENGEGVLGMLTDLVKETINPMRVGRDVKLGGIENLRDAATFDNQAHRTLVEVIPGYLGKILDELQAKPGQERQVNAYDWTKGRFTTQRGVDEGVTRHILDKSNVFQTQDETDNLIRGIMGEEFANLKPYELAAIRKLVLKEIDRGTDFNPDELLASSDRKVAKFQQALGKLRTRSGNAWDQENDRFAGAVSQWKTVRDTKADISEIGAALGGAYDRDTLLRTGLYRENRKGGLEVNQDAWNSVSATTQRGADWEQEEKKKPMEKTVAERIVRKSLSGVWGKLTGQGDGTPPDSTLGRKAIGGPVGPRWGRYADGGPTPAGDKYEAVGTVDAGEYVMDQKARSYYGDRLMGDLLKRRIPVENLKQAGTRIGRDARRLARKLKTVTAVKIQELIDRHGKPVIPLVDKYGVPFIQAVERYQQQAVDFYHANRKLAQEKLDQLMADPTINEFLQHGREGLRSAQAYLEQNSAYIFATDQAKKAYDSAKDYVTNTDFRQEARTRYDQASQWIGQQRQELPGRMEELRGTIQQRREELQPQLDEAKAKIQELSQQLGERASGLWNQAKERFNAPRSILPGTGVDGEGLMAESQRHTELLDKILTVLITKPMGGDGNGGGRVAGFLNTAVLGVGRLAGKGLMGAGRLFGAYVRGIGTAVGGIGKGAGMAIGGIAKGIGGLASGLGSLMRSGKDLPHDTYVEGADQPALLSKGMRQGRYYWMDGEQSRVIRTFKDVEKAEGNIIDRESGDVVLSTDELARGVYYKDGFGKRLIRGAWSGAGALFGSALNMAGNLASIPYRVIGLAAKAGSALLKWMGSDQVDVYLPGEKNPRLRAVKMKAGLYFVANPETMAVVKTVRGWKDIIGPVYETVPGGQPLQVLSAEEARQVCDSRGNVLATPIGKLTSIAAGFGLSVLKGVGRVAGGIVRGVGSIAGGAIRGAGRVAGGVFSLAGAGIGRAFKALGLKWNPSIWKGQDPTDAAQLDVLTKIYGLLNERMAPPRRRRKGGWQDQLEAQAAKAKEKLQDKADEAKADEPSLLDRFKSLFSGGLFGGGDEDEDEESLLDKGADALDTADDLNDLRGGGGGKRRRGRGRGKGGRLGRLFGKAKATKAGAAASKVGAKGVSAVKSLGKGLGKKLPLIGTLVTLGFGVKEAVDMSKRKDLDGSQKARGYGGIAGGVGGTLAGAAAGAAIGSVVPGVGTLIGGAVGAGVGALAGTRYGKSVVNQWQHADGLEKATMFLPGGGFLNAARYSGDNAMRMLRMAQYGVDYKDLSTVAKVCKLETSLIKGDIKDMESLWNLMGIDDGLTKSMTFGLFGDNGDKRTRFTKWYRGRFSPVFKTWQSQLASSGQKSFDDMVKCPKADLKRIVDAVFDGPKQAYSVNAHPFKDSTDFGPKEVTAVKAKALDELGVGDGSTKPWYSKFMSKAWDKTKEIAGAAWDAVKSTAGKMWDGVKSVAKGGVDLAVGTTKVAAGAVTGNRALMSQGASQAVGGAITAAAGVGSLVGINANMPAATGTAKVRENALIIESVKAGLNKDEVIALLAQASHESGGFTTVVENLKYRAEVAARVFAKHFSSVADAAATLAQGVVAFAERIYGGRMGNSQPGDGFKFIGRGLMQLTGRANYTAFRNWLRSIGHSEDVVTDPNAITKSVTLQALTAVQYWITRVRGKADPRDIKKVTYLINGGYNGLADRQQRYASYLKRFGNMSVEQMLAEAQGKQGGANAADMKEAAAGSTAAATAAVTQTAIKAGASPTPANSSATAGTAGVAASAAAKPQVKAPSSMFADVTGSSSFTPQALPAAAAATPAAVEPVRAPPTPAAAPAPNAQPLAVATAGRMANDDVGSGMSVVVTIMQQQLAVQTRMAASLDSLARNGLSVVAAASTPAASKDETSTPDRVPGNRPAEAVPMNPPIDVRRKYAS